ncbi:MAG: DUF4838 domain-containing protein [Saprospirales bacterium]|nr:DUF4838 domain-containing protein [Saprospirales bacterium]
MRAILLFILIFRLTAPLNSQTPHIVLPPNAPATDQRAARLLQHYLQQLTGLAVQVQTSLQIPATGAVVILGRHPNLRLVGLPMPPDPAEDSYFLAGKNNAFLIAGGGEMGAEYGVYDLLERLGCRKFSPRDSILPHLPDLQLPSLPLTLQKPAFPYRELHYEPAFDEGWARWHRLKTRRDKEREWGLFVHTFEQLCPANRYFSEHPEYFAWNGAQRSPGQLCLTNDTVLQLVIAALKENVRAKPAARYWSVSQNDNYDYCKCLRCSASDARYGSPAGTLLAFVNRVAGAFPDKTISTLAYQYTRQAPKDIAPASNVSICLCSIECNRGLPIAGGCPDFARDVEQWSKLTTNLMIWDYVVQFRSFISPFPNWHTLQPNLQLFQKHGVNMLFEQGTGRDRSEFSDMRAYLLAKLMWSPEANMDSILQDFGKGYYGPAQPAVWAYIHDLTTSLQENGDRLWIYDIPQNEPFLRDDLLHRHLLSLLDAEDALQNDTLRQLRVMAARLPIIFAQVERAKTDSLSVLEMLNDAPEQYREAFRVFADECKKAGFKNLHEQRYSPEAYVDDFIEFLENQRVAAGSRAYMPELAAPASPVYARGNPSELTNRRIGERDYRYNWLGFQGNNLQATVRLAGDSCSFLRVSFLQDQASWVFFPKQVLFEISANGVYFEPVLDERFEIVPDGEKSIKTVDLRLPEKRAAKYVRVTAVNQQTCPGWHTCNGNPCWIFADEIIVR